MASPSWYRTTVTVRLCNRFRRQKCPGLIEESTFRVATTDDTDEDSITGIETAFGRLFRAR